MDTIRIVRSSWAVSVTPNVIFDIVGNTYERAVGLHALFLSPSRAEDARVLIDDG